MEAAFRSSLNKNFSSLYLNKKKEKKKMLREIDSLSLSNFVLSAPTELAL